MWSYSASLTSTGTHQQHCPDQACARQGTLTLTKTLATLCGKGTRIMNNEFVHDLITSAITKHFIRMTSSCLQ